MSNSSFYWDSCSFIHFLKQTPEYYTVLKEIMKRASGGESKIVTSAVSIAEVCKIPDEGLFPSEQSDKILDMMKLSCIELWQADRKICQEAHHLIRFHGMLPMDAIHMATALTANVDVVVTTDSKKYRRKGLLFYDGKIGNPPLKIKLPNSAVIYELWEHAQSDEEKDNA